MKYIIRLLATIPALIVGISVIMFVVKAFDNPWYVILAIGNIIAFAILLSYYEDTVKDLAIIIKSMANDALHE